MTDAELTRYVYETLVKRVQQHNANPLSRTTAKLEIISLRGPGGIRFKGWRITYHYPIRTSRKDRKAL